MRPDAHARRQRGMTIVELMVALTFAGVIIGLALKVQAPERRAIVDLRKQAYACAELKLAAEWLRHDLAGGTSVTWSDPFLNIQREAAVSRLYGAWAGTWDLGISYRLDGRNLLRIDWKTAETHNVATGLTTFEPVVDGDDVQIRLAVGTGFAGRSLNLVWVN